MIHVSVQELLFNTLITARKRSLGQGYIFRSVCQEFCPQGGGGFSSVVAGIPPSPQDHAGTPGTRHPPPGPGTPLGPGRQVPPPPEPGTPLDQATPRDQAPPPPRAEHAGRYGQRAGGTHPTVMHSCLEICCQVNSGTYI